jgi:hypothetical protein
MANSGPSVNIMFCMRLMKEAHKLVKKHFPAIKVRSAAWTYHLGRGHWEFHGPERFYWHGSADNGWEARYKGWMAYLQHKGIEPS